MGEDAEILARNWASLRRHPRALTVLERTAPYPDACISAARSGEPIIGLPGTDGLVRPLHSRYEPRREARSQLPPEDDELATYLLLGGGLGYLAQELAPRLSAENTLVWLENDPRLFRTLLGRQDVHEILDRPQTRLLVGEAPDQLYHELHQNVGRVLQASVKLIVHPPSLELYPDAYAGYKKALNDFTRHGSVILRTSLYLSRYSLKNQARNLGHYLRSPGIAPMRGVLKGKPAIVVSAGPSLRRNIDELKELVGKVAIIAVSTALRPLLARGITPDFTVVIDYHRISRRYFEGVDPHHAPAMVCELKATADGVGAYPGVHLFGNDYTFNTLFEGLFGDKGDLPSASTVAHAAFHFAVHTGADPIVLLGQDLSYPGGLLHVPGTAIQTQEYPQTHRFYTFEMRELEFYLTNRPRFIKVPAIPDGEVPTCDVMFSYLKEFEGYIEPFPGTVIDATEGGARIGGTEVARLADVVRRFQAEELPDLRAVIAAATAAMDLDTLRDRALATLEQRQDDLQRLATLYRRMLKILGRIVRKNDKGKAADALVGEVKELHVESKKYGRLYLLLTQLAQADLWLRLQADRRLDITANEGVKKQHQQAIRDRDFVKGLTRATEFLAECLSKAHDALTVETPVDSSGTVLPNAQTSP